MAEPLNRRSIEHWLNFISGGEGMIRVDEPISFDSSQFDLNQEGGRYGRDVSFSGGEVDFGFPNNAGSQYGFQFDLLKTYDTIYGYESQVEYILKDTDGNIYVVGEIDFFTKETDQITYFNAKVIQSTTEVIIKRRADVPVDLFGTENLDGDTIPSIQTTKILIEAKPIVQTSEWITISERSYSFGFPAIGSFDRYFNQVREQEKYEIDLSLVPITSNSGVADPFLYIESLNELSNATLEFDLSFVIDVDGAVIDGLNFGTVTFEYFIGEILGAGIELYTEIINEANSGPQFVINTTYTINDVSIARGEKLWIWFKYDMNINSNFGIKTTINSGSKYTVTGDSTAINSVTSGIRLVDAMSQTLLNIDSDFTLDAPRYELGGEWYDNFIFNGNMIRGRNTKYPLKWDDIMDGITELNSDFEIIGDNIFVGKYDDFYVNIESAVFLQIPDESFYITYNDIYSLNKFVFKYKTFNQDKDDNNTIDAMHTNVEFALINRRVENVKEIDIPFIRDAFLLETTRKKAINSDVSGTSSLSQDNKTFIIDCVELTPGALASFSAPLIHFVNDDGDLQLLNNGTFNWALLGFVIGDTFTIINTDNADDYTVVDITSTILIITAASITPIDITEIITSVEYPLTDVDYVTRTNEDFDSITGVSSPNTYVNLLYTPKRNILNNWSSYLATCSLYNDKDIKVQSFVNEPELVTQFNGGDIITENSNITRAELDTPILTASLINCKVICDFSTYQSYKDSIRTDRGFVRIYDNENRVLKGYPKESSFQWANNILEFVLEQKYENEITNITFDSGASSYIIEEVGYNVDTLPQIEFETDGDYVQLFDSLMRPLTNRARFDRYSVNSVIFSSSVELTTAINEL